jgi:nucleoside-diphosphate-sugar epimerase
MTGFPGFIASRLAAKLADDALASQFLFLVHQSQTQKAHALCDALRRQYPKLRFSIIEGDITRPDLGVREEALRPWRSTIHYVFHLAAVYDVTVSEHEAHSVNVLGTDYVNAFVRELPSLQRYIYFSTASVSGKRTGKILETDLDHNQSFRNYYESSKFRAEQLVQKIWNDVPTTIIRPSIVVGDSKTGETDRFDGPYFILGFLHRFSSFPIPYIGRSRALLNLVPVDFVVNSTAYLARSDSARTKTFHLTDPFPYTVHEAYGRFYEAVRNKKPSWTLPAFLASWALKMAFLRRLAGAPRELVAYFDLPAIYDTSQARAELSRARISCPDFFSYADSMVQYFSTNQNNPDKIVSVY